MIVFPPQERRRLRNGIRLSAGYSFTLDTVLSTFHLQELLQAPFQARGGVVARIDRAPALVDWKFLSREIAINRKTQT